MTPPLVLLTGATGHIGSVTLLHLLKSGHTVRAAVRSEANITQILSRSSIQALNLPPGRLTFAVVPDIHVPEAYDEAAIGATHVIHIASPLATGNTVPPAQHDEFFILPAVSGTVGMLEAALRSGTVRRVVITSSIVSLVPVAEMEGTAEPRHHRSPPVRPTDRLLFIPGPYPTEFAAYAASKVAALAHAEAWMETVRPPFDVVHLHPGFVLGRNEAATKPAQVMKGTNAVVLAMLLGKRFGPYAGATVHVEDVSRAHIESLNPVRVPGNESYILSAPARWNDAKEMVKRRFPDAIESRLLVGEGNVDTTPLRIDTSLTERTFGFRLKSFEEQVVSTVKQFLELRIQQKASVTGSKTGTMRVKEALLQKRRGRSS